MKMLLGLLYHKSLLPAIFPGLPEQIPEFRGFPFLHLCYNKGDGKYDFRR